MAIFEQAVKRILKNKLRLAILLVMPILFIVTFGLQSEVMLSVGIADNDRSMLSAKLIEELGSMRKVKVVVLDEKDILDKAVSFQTDYSVIIGSGFEKALLAGKNPDIKEFYFNEKEKLFYSRAFIENFIGNMKLLAAGAGYDRASFAEALEEYENGRLSVTVESAGSAEDGRTAQARGNLGFLVQFMLYMSVVTAGLLIEDRSSGVFYRVFYSPVTLRRYMLENLAAFLIIGVFQAAVTLTMIKYVFGFDLGAHTADMYLLFTVFAIVCISLGVWLVSLFKKPLLAYITSAMITTPMLMLGGCYWPKEFMPDIMNKIARIIPTSWLMDAVDKMLLYNKGIMDVGLEILALLFFAGIFMAGGLLRKVDISKQ